MSIGAYSTASRAWSEVSIGWLNHKFQWPILYFLLKAFWQRLKRNEKQARAELWGTNARPSLFLGSRSYSLNYKNKWMYILMYYIPFLFEIILNFLFKNKVLPQYPKCTGKMISFCDSQWYTIKNTNNHYLDPPYAYKMRFRQKIPLKRFWYTSQVRGGKKIKVHFN